MIFSEKAAHEDVDAAELCEGKVDHLLDLVLPADVTPLDQAAPW